MARVWRAYDPNLDVERAIKEPLFDQNLSQDVLDEMGRRFVAEGRAAARLSHPGIVTIHAADVYDGRPAIVMELVDGETLSQRLERGRLQPAEALDVLDQLLDAVGHAHGKGIVHRDIKPDNIFITEEGRVKLADFGIAHVDDSGATRATMVGTVLGTPGYMSPEQAAGRPVDERSDLFSVGVVGYEMLAGTNPFNPDGTDATTLLYRIVHEPAPELPEKATAGLPDDLRPAIMAALEKDPGDRPQSAGEFKGALHGGELPLGVAGNRHLSEAAAPEKDEGVDAARKADGRALPKWLPYAAVAGVAAVVLGVLLFNSGGPSGGFSPYPQTDGNASTQGAVSSTGGAGADSATRAANDLQSAYYLAASDGYVAIFSNSQATPYQITNLPVANLGSDIQSRLDGRIPFSSVDDALSQVEEWRGALQAAEEEAARQAEEEAARKAAEEEAARKAAEEAAAAQEHVGAQPNASMSNEPFWGIWIGAFKSRDNAYERLDQANAKGLNARICVTSEWEKLNPETYYAVSAGSFGTKQDAEAFLEVVKSSGYDDAYVRYTGSKK